MMSPQRIDSRRQLNIILMVLTLIMAVAGGYSYVAYLDAQQQIQRAEEAKRKAQHKAALADQAAQRAAQQVQLALQEKNYAFYTQSLFLAPLSEQETARGNAVDGALLALESLPKNLATPDRPFLIQAEINLRQALDKLYERQVIRGHKGEIWQLLLSPDKKILASASADGTVKLWDTATGILKHSLQHHDQVWEMSFNSEGSKLATAALDHQVRVWNVEKGELLATLTHSKEVYSVVFAGNSIISADAGGIIKVWDEGLSKMLLNAHRSAIRKLSISPTHPNHFLSASQDFTAKLWHLNGKVLQTFKGHQAAVNTAIFSPDGKIVLTAGDDHQAILWEAETGKRLKNIEFNDAINGAVFYGEQFLLFGAGNTAELWTIQGSKLAFFQHNQPLTDAKFNENGSQIITSSEDGTIKLWKSNGELITSLAGHDGEVYDAVFYQQNQLFSAGEDGHIRRWELQNNQQLAKIAPFRGVTFNLTGQKMLLFSELGANLLEAETGELIQTLTDQPIATAAFSLDGQQLAVGGFDGKTQIFDLKGQLIVSFEGNFNDTVTKLQFNPNGQRLLVLTPDGVKIWDTAQPFELKIFIRGKYSAAGWTPDGQLIFTGDSKGQVIFWDGAEPYRAIDAHSQAINQVVFNPDGSKFLSISKDLTAKLWHTEDRRLLTTLSGHNGELRHAAFAATSDKILTTSADGTARVWDGFSGAPLGVLRGHKVPVLSGKFTQDGTRAVTWGEGGDVKLWDIKTNTEIATLAKNALVAGVNKQLTRLVTCQNTEAVLWAIYPDTQGIIERAHQILPRPLSVESRIRYFLEGNN